MTSLSKKFFIAGITFFIVAIITVSLVVIYKPQNKTTALLPKIRIAYNIQSLDNVPIMIAYHNGYFHDQGIDVELIQLSGSEQAVALGSGQVDIATLSAPRLYGPIEKGAPIKILSPISNTLMELFIRPDSGITSLKDLESKNLSYGTGGGTKELMLRYILKIGGVDIDKINLVPIDQTYLHIALMDKKVIDAAVIADAQYIDEANKLGAIVLPEWQKNGYSKLSTPIVVAANTNYLSTNEENVSGFFKAIIEANRYLKSHPNESADISTKFMKDNSNGAIDMKSNDFLNLLNQGMVTYSLWKDPKLIVELAHVSYEIEQIGRVLSLDDLYDFRFKDLLESAENEIYPSTTP